MCLNFKRLKIAHKQLVKYFYWNDHLSLSSIFLFGGTFVLISSDPLSLKMRNMSNSQRYSLNVYLFLYEKCLILPLSKEGIPQSIFKESKSIKQEKIIILCSDKCESIMALGNTSENRKKVLCHNYMHNLKSSI